MLDLNRNIRPTVGNLSLPTRLFGPRELFGSKLLTHVDAMDYRNFSTDKFDKINPPNTGNTIIQSIFDISPYARRYNILSSHTLVSETSTTWTTTIPLTTTTQGFSASSFDTNKGTFPIYDNFAAGQGIGSASGFITPYDGYRDLAPTSAFTLCNWVAHQGQGTNAPWVVGMGVFTRASSTYTISFEGSNGSNNMFFTLKDARQSKAYALNSNNSITTMHLITVTGYNYYWYVDSNLYDSGPVTGVTLYPFTAASANNRSFYFNNETYVGFVGHQRPLARTLEGFFASEYTTPEQVKLLYDYFIVKSKNKLGKFR